MNTLQEYRRPLLVGVIALVVAILVYALLIAPQSSKLSSLDNQAIQLQTQETALQAKLTSLQRAKQQLPANCADLRKIAAQIPSVKTPGDIAAEESSFETQMNALLAQTGASIVSFSGFAPPTTATAPAAGSAPTDGVVPIPLTLTVTGTYGQMSAFVSQLDTFPRLFVIQKFTLSLGSGSGSGSGSATATPTAGASGGNPLWVGGTATPAAAGPYSLALAGSIYYTTSPTALSACDKLPTTTTTATAK
jgi:Tfp pilus assembly protein PilO